MIQLTKEESDRIRIAKCIAIILVVFLHAYTMEVNFADGSQAAILPAWLELLETGVSQKMARCGVPIFFLLSAVLLFCADRTYKEVIRKKIRTLFVPYLIWNTFWIAVFLILQSLPFTAAYFSGSNTPILQSSVYEWFGLYGIGREYPHCYPLWFMRDLMVAVLFFPLIGKAADKSPGAAMCIGIGLIVSPFSFFCKTAFAWFFIGAAVVKKKGFVTVFDKYSMIKIGVLYFGSGVIVLFLDHPVSNDVFLFVGMMFWLRLSKEIYDRRKLRRIFVKLSEWVFIIYVLHELTLSSVRKICFRMFPAAPLFWLLEYLFLPVVVITGCVVAGMVLKKCMPEFYRVSTGER